MNQQIIRKLLLKCLLQTKNTHLIIKFSGQSRRYIRKNSLLAISIQPITFNLRSSIMTSRYFFIPFTQSPCFIEEKLQSYRHKRTVTSFMNGPLLYFEREIMSYWMDSHDQKLVVLLVVIVMVVVVDVMGSKSCCWFCSVLVRMV